MLGLEMPTTRYFHDTKHSHQCSCAWFPPGTASPYPSDAGFIIAPQQDTIACYGGGIVLLDNEQPSTKDHAEELHDIDTDIVDTNDVLA